ncbi:MAG: hypothetical protein ABR512_16275, partial [Desulfopila sp.]
TIWIPAKVLIFRPAFNLMASPVDNTIFLQTLHCQTAKHSNSHYGTKQPIIESLLLVRFF